MKFSCFSLPLPWWPRSLFGRLACILFFGLAMAHALSFSLILYEKGRATSAMMVSYLAKDVASAVAILEHVPAAERPTWLSRLDRSHYRYMLSSAADGEPCTSPLAEEMMAAITGALGPNYSLTATQSVNGKDTRLRLHLRLADGAPLAIELSPPPMVISPWVALVLSIQLAILAALTWLAVRLATQPLARLSRAADALGPDLRGAPLAEEGPLEVARAAKAFNAMQRRIADHLAERMQILAAVSHDLQTPITRMRLRADLLDSAALRDKLHGDLNAMQALVEEGIAYARSAQGITELPCRTDLYALLDSVVCDYVDAGQDIRLTGRFDRPLVTRPHAVRRVITNLVDNAIKFGRDVEIAIDAAPAERVSIAVRDRGPGILPTELKTVLEPFYRVENSRNRETGGTGLGLAIAQQLVAALGGTLTLLNRDGGGLEARFSLPITA